LFGIGSTTKAFTANLIASLVDEGVMHWDDPVTKYLPYLQFNLANKNDEISIRDMMSHQTGFTRFNLLYANGKVDRDDMLKAAIKAEPWAGFREKFLYTNLMVTGAGVAAAQSVNTNWEDLLENRLLKPLGMKNTTAHYNKAQESPFLSSGYMWQEEQNKHKKLTMHNITNIGPAGAINSNVDDMAKWLKLQLNNGNYKGKQIVSATQIQETWSPQIKIGSGAAYGLGWMMREYKGQKLVVHDGSVEGYSAIVALLPESNMGYVLLTNLTQTALLGDSLNTVFASLLDNTEENKVDKSIGDVESAKNYGHTYDEYIGEYIANFATFKNEHFKFHLKDGKAYLDVPSQMDYELKAPDQDGKMYFAATDSISISFDKDSNGNVTALRMQQGGMNFELQKKGVPVIAEIDTNQFNPYLGKYASKLFNGEITVKVQNQRLTVDVPGQMAFELHLPDAQNRRHFRIKDSMSIDFERDAINAVAALNVYQSGTKIDTANKKDIKTHTQLPSIADILKLRKTEQRILALKNNKGFRLKGKVTMKQSGVVGQVTTIFNGYHHFREEIDFGQYGSIITVLNEKSAAIAPSFAAFMEQHGKYYEQTRRLHPASLIDWHLYYDEIEVTNATVFNNRKAYIVRLHGGDLPATEITVDSENGDTLKQESKMLNPTFGSIPVVTIFENYQEKFGLRIPLKVSVKNDINGESSIEIDHIESNFKFKPSLFILNNPDAGE
jgi:CubicO group peptidase (beta-lactamase class C family)